MTPTGRSYHVQAPDPVAARIIARAHAAAERHPGAKTCRVLHIERITETTYEVVLEAR